MRVFSTSIQVSFWLRACDPGANGDGPGPAEESQDELKGTSWSEMVDLDEPEEDLEEMECMD